METLTKAIISFAGALISYLFGGWSALLGVLLFFVIADYFSALAAATINKEGLSSKIGFRGIPRKVLIFVVVAVGHMVDQVLGDGHIFRDAVIFFYLVNELISILENVAKAGLPVPSILQKAITILKDKGEKV